VPHLDTSPQSGAHVPAIRPTFEEFERLARGAKRVPVTREVLADALTPVAAFAAVGGGEGSYLLESVVGGERWGRYSFVGFDPDLRVRARGRTLEIRRGSISAGSLTLEEGVDPWRRLRDLVLAERIEQDWLPPFWGGAVGYVSHEAIRTFEPKALSRPRARGDAWEFSFAIGGTVVVFDDVRKTAKVVISVSTDGVSLRAAYDDAVQRIEGALARLSRPTSLGLMDPAPGTAPNVPVGSMSREAFKSKVEVCKEHIRAGDAFQIVLSQRFRQAASDVDIFEVYRAMRAMNPSPYMFFLRFEEATVAGASPETMVRVVDGKATVRPLAGTRRRGSTPEADRAAEAELRGDPKEIAEHVMLVDLGRNDLGRVCAPGSVCVTDRMVMERYSHVMHLTSNVEGQVADGKDALDVLASTFPAGTLSGAPKVRAIQILDQLEEEPRGLYGGGVGYLGWNGNLDMAIAIRTVVQTEGELRVQAGAGIVEASDPDAEYEETLSKARAALTAIETARRS
jgi:anthranilate synthase component I